MEDLFALSFSKNKINSISSLGLAHVGDAVYELLCRSWLCVHGDQTVKTLHRDTVALVKATKQAEFAQKLLPLLTEEELSWFRRGKNAHISVPKSATREQYSLATGLEALFGALYLSGRKDRLNELFAALME